MSALGAVEAAAAAIAAVGSLGAWRTGGRRRNEDSEERRALRSLVSFAIRQLTPTREPDGRTMARLIEDQGDELAALRRDFKSHARDPDAHAVR